jgi:hypothetical protein
MSRVFPSQNDFLTMQKYHFPTVGGSIVGAGQPLASKRGIREVDEDA